MGLDELLTGQELIIKHNNSIKDLPPKGLKEYCPNNSWLEGKQIQAQLEERYNFINAERIEKSNSVAQAQWIPHLKKAKLTKHLGKLWETLGHHQDNEDWLLPEEALFLIENSELQLIYDDVSLSIEDCYELVFNEGGCSLDEYKVFSYLCRAGYRVIRHSTSVRVTQYEKQVRLDAIVQSQKRDAPDVLSMTSVPDLDNKVDVQAEPIHTHSASSDRETTVSLASKQPGTQINVKSHSESPEVEILPGPSSRIPKVERSLPEKAQNHRVPEETIVLIESDDDENELEIREISDSDSDSDVVCISSPSYNPPNTNSRGWYPKLDKCLRRTLEKVVDLCDDENENAIAKYNIRNKMDLIRASKSEILSRLPSVENVVTSFVVADKMLLPPNSVPKFSEYKTRVNIKADTRSQNDFTDQRVGIYERPQYCETPNGIGNYNNFIQNVGGPNGFDNYNDFNQNCGAPNGSINNFNSFLQNPLWAKAQQMQAMAMNMIQTANQLMTVMSTANNNPNELWDLLGNNRNALAPYNYRPPFMQHHPRFSGYQRRPYRHYRPYRRRPWSQRRQYHSHSSNYANQPPSDDIKPDVNIDDVVVLSDGDDVVEVIGNYNQLIPLTKRKNEIIDEGEKRCKMDSDLDGQSESSSCVMDSALDTCKKEPGENDVSLKKEIKPIVKNEVNEGNKSTSVISSGDHSAIISIKSESENSLDSNAFSQNNDVNSCQNPVPEKPLTASVVNSDQIENSTGQYIQTTDNITNVSTSQESQLMEVENKVSEEDKNEPSCSRSHETVSEISNANEQSQEIMNWEQFKQSDNLQEEDFGEAFIRLDGYVSYGNILSSLKIFKQIEGKTHRTHFKISFDVFLPESNFKKSLKVLPNYRVIVLKPKDSLPSSVDIEGLKILYQDVIEEEYFANSISLSQSIRKFFKLVTAMRLGECEVKQLPRVQEEAEEHEYSSLFRKVKSEAKEAL